MRKTSISILLAALLLTVIAFTVFSQGADTDESLAEIQILQGGVSQQVPVNITMLVPTESGVQTVTVPLQLNLELTVGPVDAADLAITVDSPQQFVSPIMVIEPTVPASTITATATITATDTITP